MDQFSLRLNCLDYYQSTSTSLDPQFQDAEAKVPVIRVFGATPTGQKVCAHIHGALPYLYVEYDGSLASDEANYYIYRLQVSINHALGVAYRRKASEGKSKFVAHISLVKGTPFYGYFEGFKFYLKMYLFNPQHMARLADLLRQGAVMKKVFQPYESHLQYQLQWMCDYNLHGCDYINCSKVAFRGPVPAFEEMRDNAPHAWHDQSIPSEAILDEVGFPRLSHAPLEVDICVQDILNRHEIKPRLIHHDFVEHLYPPPAGEKFVYSMASLWKEEAKRRKATTDDSGSNNSPFFPEALVSMSAEPRHTEDACWINEAAYMERVREIISEERTRYGNGKVDFSSFSNAVPLADTVKTALESVEELFPENLQHLFRSAGGPHAGDLLPADATDLDVDVDESRILDNDEQPALSASDDESLEDADVNVETSHGNPPENIVANKPGPSAKPNGDPADVTKKAGGGESSRVASISGRPTTSDELAEYGIFKVSDMETAAWESFSIPLEYSKGPGSKRLTVESHLLSDPAQPRKRRKLSRNPEEPDSKPRLLKPVSNGKGVVPFKTHQRSEQNPAAGPVEQRSEDSAALSQRSSARASQESIKANAVTENRCLAFPVVKDPHEPSSGRKQKQPTEASVRSPSWKAASFGPVNVQERSQSAIFDSAVPSLDEASSPPNATLLELARNIHAGFGGSTVSGDNLCISSSPPTKDEVTFAMRSGSMSIIYQDAYYSLEKDVPRRPREYAGKTFRLAGNTVPFLPDFDSLGGSSLPSAIAATNVSVGKALAEKRRVCSLRNWEFMRAPPGRREVEAWCLENKTHVEDGRGFDRPHRRRPNEPITRLSQIDGPTQKRPHGFKFSQNGQSARNKQESQYMSIMSLEVHVNTKDDRMPNPQDDEISCVFWCYQPDNALDGGSDGFDAGGIGILALSEDGGLARRLSREVPVHVEEEETELGLINRLIDIVRICDPDILTGYEIRDGSWGYIIERARRKYEFNLCNEFSRMKSQSHGRFGKDNDRWGFNHSSTIIITGRHMVNIWRAMKSELNLLQYTLENIAFHFLHRRIPHYSHKDLTNWYRSNKSRDVAKVLDYYINRVQIDLEILEKNELVARTSEQARLLGVDFFAVYSRGSQYKVESLMFRIAKAESFVLVSPSKKQVGQQNALECLPLVMEPQSDFYNSPLVVLDFQSLYPSIMIAYNYCYSTFVGRVASWRGQNKMGFSNYRREPRLLELLQNDINIAPNGIMYVKPHIRRSLLAKMLGEILDTRVMVKSSMKTSKDNRALQRLLNNRQLALKLIANVTYGYTSASFSGRMPCSEIADSIVQTGRETLEKAIALIHSVPRWRAEVVYGDTDSLFVYLKGRSKDEAFDIGNEIAEAVTNASPRPIKLKFEKVYLPSLLLAKKRYVGFKYESRKQKEPDFDAKGIETVRRDGTPAEQKIEETALKILFRTADLSQVKAYFQKQCNKILQGKVSIQDFCFAKEVRLGTYSDKGPPPPGALVSAKKMLKDPRAEPQFGQRVSYVVITGAPGARLMDRCVAPETLLYNEHHELDAEYYISKNIIPPLERIFNLVGANVRAWYDEMPKVQRVRRVEASDANDTREAAARKTLESYMKSSVCLVCRERVESDTPVCQSCLSQSSVSLLALSRQLAAAETKAVSLEKVCRSCASLAWGEPVKCDSKDCPVFYTRTRHMSLLRSTRAAVRPASRLLESVEAKLYDW